jgi:hypothetical protein
MRNLFSHLIGNFNIHQSIAVTTHKMIVIILTNIISQATLFGRWRQTNHPVATQALSYSMHRRVADFRMNVPQFLSNLRIRRMMLAL